MRSGSTPNDSQPPIKPSGKLLQNPPGGSRSPSPDRRVESLKQEVASILKNTEWPTDSTESAEGLLDVINSSPEVSNATTRVTAELQNLVERYIQVLEDVRLRLKDASSKSEMKRWKFLERIRSLASNRPSKCTLLFQTCRDDVSKVLKALNERLDLERAKEEEGVGKLGSPPQAQFNSVAQSPALGPPSGTPQPGTTADDSTPSSLLPKQPQSNTHEDHRDRSQISDAALTIARKTFKSVEIGSGAIPVVGNYVGAAAKVGLAFVEMLQTIDRNHGLAIDLGEHTSKLTKLLENFKDKSSTDEQDIAGQIKELHAELGRVKEKVEEWNSLGRFTKAFSARDHAETLKDYQGTIQTAREEMQLLVSLDCRNIVIELESIEARKKRRRLLKCLGDGQYGARGNTIEDITCFPGTRMEVLKRINDWIRDSSLPNPVLWIPGMAGRGKSTIASTVVHTWKCRASCAIFHFRRGQSAVNSRVICALARQLGNSLVPEVKEAVLESVQENQDIADPGRRLEEQFETLLVTPLAKLKNHPHPILIVVDALDECDNPKDAVDFVRLIDRHSSSFPANVKFLLTCRPEAAVLRNLGSKQWRKEDLDSAPDMNDDLSRFLQGACIRIRDDHDLSEDWPSPGDIERLVQMSQGLFQWACTAVTYISNGSPTDRLRTLLKRPSAWSGLDDLYHQILSKAFDSLRLDPSRQDILSRVLGTLVVAPYPVSLEVIASLYEKHEVFDGESLEKIVAFLRKDILADLNSLLFIPESPTKTMRLMHTSIQDLLVSELRCKRQPFYVDPAHCHQQLANTCLKAMLERLKKNIGSLSDASKPSSDVQDVVDREISQALQYCCRAWSIHLTQGVKWPESRERATTAELVYFESFSEGKIMYWLEVMSLVGATKEAVTAANRVLEWLLQRTGESQDPFSALWDDIKRFITTFMVPISFGPLHIYASALPHCPEDSEVWNLYKNHASVRMVHGQRMSTWPSNIWARYGILEVMTIAFSPDGRVLAVADYTITLLDTQTGTAVGEEFGPDCPIFSICFSPDGKLLASGSYDKTIRLWDIETGAAVGQPLTGHSDRVNSVCFSPDGNVLASGSDDGTVRLWSAQTGEAIGGPLKDHSDRVQAVCFSPDGRRLASGSSDMTIRLWNQETGTAVGEPLAGHSSSVAAVCFSPDGMLLASGSDDKMVRLWNAQNGAALGEPLTGHSGSVFSVCFSPDGKVLASGSDDYTVQLWNIQTGAAIVEPLTGHNNSVRSVCFSPDGKLLASGSEDGTIRLWDPLAGATVAGSLVPHRASVKTVHLSPDGKRLVSTANDYTIQLWDPWTGAAVGEPLTGHSLWVQSPCFSPDGKLLASGSNDCTIRLWDPHNVGAVGEPLIGHSAEVLSVCFSPDGELLASGSEDMTIRLWDPRTGAAVGEPLIGHSDGIHCVCFSPDGKLLATASFDQTIRLWEAQVGVAVGEPLIGHSAGVLSLCFSPEGKILASGSFDCTVRLWDPYTGEAVGAPLEGHSYWVGSISFLADGKLLAHCDDGSFAIWDPITLQRCDSPDNLPPCVYPRFQGSWIKFGPSPLLWLPPQYWDTRYDAVVLFGGLLATFQNGSLYIFDVSRVVLQS